MLGRRGEGAFYSVRILIRTPRWYLFTWFCLSDNFPFGVRSMNCKLLTLRSPYWLEFKLCFTI